MAKVPHVLMIPSWYPTPTHPILGVFFKQQAEAIQTSGRAKIGVIYPNFRSLRTLQPKALLTNYFQNELTIESEIPTLRLNGWAMPIRRLNRQLWVAAAHGLAQRYIRQFGKPDVIHAQSVVWGGVAAAEISQRLGIPFVITEHATSFQRGLFESWQLEPIKDAFSKAANVVTVSKSLAGYVAPYSDKTPKVINNMVDTDFFTLPSGRESSPYRFLAVGSLIPRKGLDLLIGAFAQKFAGQADVLLEIGGDGEQRAHLQQLADSVGVGSQVKFLGLLDRTQVREAMWRANAFVVSSLIETFSVVAIEALSTGLPVIATRCGGPEEFVTPEVGFLVQPKSIGELADALERMRLSAASFDAQHLRRYANARFSKQHIAEQIMSVYATTLDRGVAKSTSPVRREYQRRG